MKRLSSVLPLLLLAGCFNPDDILPVHGQLTSPDPVSSQPVRLLRDSLAEGGPTCSEARPFKDTLTDEAGAFSFDVFRAQAQKLTGFGQFCFRVETTFPSGSAAFSDIQRLDSELSLPTFPDWRASPARVDGVIQFEPAAPLPAEETFEGDQLVHRAEWFTADGGLAWVAEDRFLGPDRLGGCCLPARQPMGLNDFVLEDFSGALRLSARITEVSESVGPFGGSATSIEVSSGQTLALTGARVPVSRGLPCPALGSPCPLTDGELTSVDAGGAQGVSLTLATPVPLSAVVVRGLVSSSVEAGPSLMAVLLLSADGGMLPLVQLPLSPSLWNGGAPTFVRRPRRDGGFEYEAQAEARYLVIPLDGGVPIGSVFVGIAGGMARISEVSLFE